jgi:hypothetical protein
MRPPVPCVGVATALFWLSGIQFRPSWLTARCHHAGAGEGGESDESG